MYSIQTKRLVLAPYCEKDMTALKILLTDRRIGENFMLPDFKSDEEALNAAKTLMGYSASGEQLELGIYLDGALIGFINEVEKKDGMIELGYVIHPDFHNNGYATEAFLAVIARLLADGFHSVRAGAFTENAASIRVIEKCGLKRIDKEEYISYHGKKRRCIYFERAEG